MPGQRFQSQPVNTPERPTDSSQTPDSGTPQPVVVQRYRSYAPIITILIAVVVVVLVVVAVRIVDNYQANGKPGASPSAGPLPGCATPSPGWQSIPFEVGSSTSGCWAVSEGQWNGDTVTLETTVTVDQGTLDVTFFALDNSSSANQYDPSGGTMIEAQINSGQSSSGTLEFEIPPGDFTLYMLKNPMSPTDSPIQALVIKG